MTSILHICASWLSWSFIGQKLKVQILYTIRVNEDVMLMSLALGLFYPHAVSIQQGLYG